jgi:hypothetical protein
MLIVALLLIPRLDFRGGREHNSWHCLSEEIAQTGLLAGVFGDGFISLRQPLKKARWQSFVEPYYGLL